MRKDFEETFKYQINSIPPHCPINGMCGGRMTSCMAVLTKSTRLALLMPH